MSQFQKYIENQNKLEKELSTLQTQSNQLSTLRLILALLAIVLFYFFLTRTEHALYLLGFGASVLFYVLLVIKHRKILELKQLKQNKLGINIDEIHYLKDNVKPSYEGTKYINSDHLYSFDLDIFGKESLFHHLNRTTTYMGQEELALQLLGSQNDLLKRQEAIQELSKKEDWRQDFLAWGKMAQNQEEIYKQLQVWKNRESVLFPKWVKALAYVLPLVFITILVLALVPLIPAKFCVLAFVANLVFFGTNSKVIKQEVLNAKHSVTAFKYYALLLKHIENTSFSSSFLKEIQAKALTENKKASTQIDLLSKRFLAIEGVNFDLGAIFLNGTLCYHIHAYERLIEWKKENSPLLDQWLECIAQIDALCSIAQMANNYPEFNYPTFNTRQTLTFKKLGHPLINQSKRVCNNVTLNTSNFVILTGSNMSGKSTFLRTLGINLVLAQMGAPICAEEACLEILPMMVSMRQTDSLSSGESYFFAEVKRLKTILDKAVQQPSFILLDEILRGTNSDDKQSGTMGVIEKIVQHPMVGCIATHDLEVCKMAEKYPNKLENKNFEVQIINNELCFDYTLRSGICKNKSATFLMQKMGII